ncbi:hypothetical protein AGABI2DRAFT_211293 [Agaricus bisporus var. bisporus H97]|uniref:hypothetical protein n=1 Tax=Agaricus bisporus var. bisporus (strain H97 / ATCC MYA-4626 / FGSC 10389) TaxID=936046 RepID=UPI00029F62E7|nr:hypothetical protein AGABI2DRAFT_211293 [Agaricus bisporus var. bisporus H97]EKV42691.1 hypothetical protein AGABI2DRAFT_211293 [Agaricus bisporus var. bisporus H97]
MSVTSDIINQLTSNGIIPDVLPPDSFTPSVFFTIVYPNTDVQTNLGNEVQRSNVLDEPEISIAPLNVPEVGDGEVRYTLVMTDPDAPKRFEPKFREWRHWVITGLQVTNTQPGKADVVYAAKTKPATTPYWPPGPPPESGLHRYTFLLFEEPKGGVTIPQGAVEYGTALEQRRSWNAMKFAGQYNLKLVGANFFLCQG